METPHMSIQTRIRSTLAAVGCQEEVKEEKAEAGLLFRSAHGGFLEWGVPQVMVGIFHGKFLLEYG